MVEKGLGSRKKKQSLGDLLKESLLLGEMPAFSWLETEVATHILVLLPHAALSFCFSHCCLLWTPQLGERWKHSHISSEHRNKLEQHFTHFIEKAAPVTASPAAQHREGSRSYTLGEGLPWVNCFKASPTPLCLNLVTACTKASTPDKPFTVHKLQSSELQTYTGRN